MIQAFDNVFNFDFVEDLSLLKIKLVDEKIIIYDIQRSMTYEFEDGECHDQDYQMLNHLARSLEKQEGEESF